MTKDRLVELKAGRVEIRSGLNNGVNQSRQEEISEKKKKKNTEKNVIKEQQKMEEMFAECKQVREWIETIEEDTKTLKKLHALAIHNPRAEEDTKDKLMDTMVKIKTISLRVKSGLKSLEKRMGGKMSLVMARMLSVQHTTLLKRYQSAITDYQTALVTYKERCESLIKTQLRIAGAQCATNEEMEALLDQENTQVFVDNYFRETKEAKQILLAARVRHNELIHLEKAIQEVRDLFMDMSILIQSQGEVIDRIEDNVQESIDKVLDGREDLGKGERYRIKARKKKMWLLMCVLTVLLVFIILGAIKIALDKII